jgi:hypothetical protein
MKIETAKKVLIKECEFLGVTFETMRKDIEKHGSFMFPLKVMEAIEVLQNAKYL